MATERVVQHIERLREKPEHVRHAIAFGVAAGVTSLVALGWITAMATSGSLALKSSAAVEEVGAAGSDVSEAVEESTSAFSNLVGAAGAALGATSTEAALRVIETRTTSTLDSQQKPANDTDKTVIPF